MGEERERGRGPGVVDIRAEVQPPLERVVEHLEGLGLIVTTRREEAGDGVMDLATNGEATDGDGATRR